MGPAAGATSASKFWIALLSVVAVIAALQLQQQRQAMDSQAAGERQAQLHALLQPFESDSYAICSGPHQAGSRALRLLRPWHWLALSQGLTPAVQTLQGAEGSGTVPCLVISNGRVAAIGDEDAVETWCRSRSDASAAGGISDCPVRRLPQGYTILPSFGDAHGHLLALGQSLESVDLTGASSLAECIARIEEFILSRPEVADNPDRWIQGNGWDQTKWNDTLGDEFPTSQDLDRSSIIRGRLISLKRIDFHALWISGSGMQKIAASGGLSRAGASERSSGGLVVRDPVSGEPTGILVDNAMQLALAVIPPWSQEERTRYLAQAQSLLWSLGITSVGDAAASIEDISFYQRLAENGQLGLRVNAFLACPADNPRCADTASVELGKKLPMIAVGKGASTAIIGKGASRGMLTVRTVKLFADGALGSWGSAMWEPYQDRPDETGLLLIPEGTLPSLVRYWSERGWQVAAHAIGDRANTLVLDAFEQLGEVNSTTAGGSHPAAAARHRIEHAQLVRPADHARFSRLGVVASMQPTHCTSDSHYVTARLGAKRAADEAYPWRSLHEAGAHLTFGSDFPVEHPSAIEGIWSAVTRIGTAGMDEARVGHVPQPWYGEQRLTVSQAVRTFTANVAFAQHEEDQWGTLEPGKRADFVVVEGDLFTDITVEAAQTHYARLGKAWRDRGPKVVGTAMGGKWVWTRT
ncbi:unnamed protein product [Parajaminaea phylloscopi]